MIIDLEYAVATAAGMTAIALVFLPLVYIARLPAWVSALPALAAIGGFGMFRSSTVFEYAVEPYTRIDAPYFILGAAISGMVCAAVSRFSFRHALAWQLSALASVAVCWALGAIAAFPVVAFLTGAAIGLFRIHSLRTSIALYSVVASWLMFVVVALHPAMWGELELGALVRNNLPLALAPVAFGMGIQLGAALHRRMIEAHLNALRVKAELEFSTFVGRLWPEPATRNA
ncbi:MAG: hypothetical protein ABL932_04740 [Terricaulis sp.]